MHRAEHVVFVKNRTRKDLFWSSWDDVEVITKMFSVFIYLQGGTFTLFLFTKLKAEKTKP